MRFQHENAKVFFSTEHVGDARGCAYHIDHLAAAKRDCQSCERDYFAKTVSTNRPQKDAPMGRAASLKSNCGE